MPIRTLGNSNTYKALVILVTTVCCCLVAKSCPILCDSVDCSTLGFPVLHSVPEFAQTHVHWVNDTIQSSHPLLLPPPLSLSLSQHQVFLQWVSSLHQVAKVLKLQHQSFQWIFRVDFLTEYLFYARYGTNHFLYINLIFIRILWGRYS